ncbi:eCIS core domain-containing protein [Streptomyces sp. NPDC002640]
MIARRARSEAAPDAPATGVRDVLRSAGKPLAGPVREEMEARLGADFSDVRLHTGASARRSAADIGARAYTSGSHVVIGDGGGDKHTLAHELTHVVQQRRGPVSGTDNGAGLSVSDPSDRFEREAEANAHRVMAGPAPQAPSSHDGTTRAATAGAGHAVQRRSATPLADRIGDEAVPADVSTAVARYDKLKDFDLQLQIQELRAIQALLPNAPGPVRDTVAGELQFVTAELEALRATLQGEDGAYDLMTQQGLLWTEEGFPYNTGVMERTGRPYFEALSAGNLQGLQAENASPVDAEWYGRMRGELEQELRTFVVRHYTPERRVKGLLSDGMQSRAGLEANHGGGENNTDPYDVHVLANTGFVFFYLEAPDAGFRDSRFTGPGVAGDEGRKTRITLGLEESGLLSKGWIMLSDFSAREFPTLLAKREPAVELRSVSKNINHFIKNNKGFARLREHKRDGIGGTPAPQDVTQERRTEWNKVRGQLADEAKGRQVYTGPKVGREPAAKVERPELLHQNLLVGRDIVPGLVERALAEVHRIDEVDPKAGQVLRAKNARDLLLFLLKDVIRPQAMVPGPVHVEERHIEYA